MKAGSAVVTSRTTAVGARIDGAGSNVLFGSCVGP